MKQYRTIEQMCSDSHSITLKNPKQYRTIAQMCSDAHSITFSKLHTVNWNIKGTLSIWLHFLAHRLYTRNTLDLW